MAAAVSIGGHLRPIWRFIVTRTTVGPDALIVQSDITLPVLMIWELRNKRNNFCGQRFPAIALRLWGSAKPAAAADVAAIRTRRPVEGNELVISGQKLWDYHGTRADFVILAGAYREEKYKGISMGSFPRIQKASRGKEAEKVGNLASDTAELFFDDAGFPERYVLGESGRGFYYTMENFRASAWPRA